MTTSNTRQAGRAPVTLKIKFKSETLNQFIERYSADVSHGGIFIRTKDPLAVGTQLRFEFQLKDSSPLITGDGTVVWTRTQDPSRPNAIPGMGVKFDRLPTESQDVLAQILAKKTSKAAQSQAQFDSPTRVVSSDQLANLDPGASSNGQEPITRRTLMGVGPMALQFGAASYDHTPLPKPRSLHDDASENAFEETTRVASVDAMDQLAKMTMRGQSVAGIVESGDPALAATMSDVDRMSATEADPDRSATDFDELESDKHGANEFDETPATTIEPSKFSEAIREAHHVESLPLKDSDGGGALDNEETKQAKVTPFEPSLAKISPEASTASGLLTVSPVSPVTAVAVADVDPGQSQPVSDSQVISEERASTAVAKSGGKSLLWAAVIMAALGGAGFAFWKTQMQNPEPAATSPTPEPTVPSNVNSAVPTPSPSEPAPAPTEPAKLAGKMSVTTIPPGANVELVATKNTQPGPATFDNLEPGASVSFKVSKAGYVEQTVTAKVGDPDLTVTLVRKPWKLAVVTTPPGAAINVFGKRQPGFSPLNNVVIPKDATEATVTITRTGYQAASQIVKLETLPLDDKGEFAVLSMSVTLEQNVAAPPAVAPAKPAPAKPVPVKPAPAKPAPAKPAAPKPPLEPAPEPVTPDPEPAAPEPAPQPTKPAEPAPAPTPSNPPTPAPGEPTPDWAK